MSNRSRGRVAAMIGVSMAAVGALGAFGVNSWARADTGYHYLVVQLKNPVESLWIVGPNVVSIPRGEEFDANKGFCVRGPLGAGPLTTPYRLQNLGRVKVISFSSRDCSGGAKMEKSAQVPGEDGTPYFTLNFDN
jgi:hypothetical protein